MKNYSLYAMLAFLMVLLFSAPAQAGTTIELVDTETIPTGSGVKSVILSPDGTKVYAANLEGMSVYEFQRDSRKLLRRLAFVPTPGKGYNYTTKEEIDSYEEKPVEQHITHDGRYLWVSLHNAGGVVVWDLEDGETYVEGQPYKDAKIYLEDGSKTKQRTKLLFIKTGKTPKVITSSPDGSYLFVANWHSDTVSVIDITEPEPAKWKKIADIKAHIPRGIVVSEDSQTLYLAEMGTEHVSIIDLTKMKKINKIHVGLNPRHLVLDHGQLFVSLNLGSQLAKVNLDDLTIEKTQTCNLPRTIGMPRNLNTIFSVCYKGDKLQAFSSEDLSPVGEWESGPHPVGLDVFSSGEPQDPFEVWVANYTAGALTVYTFKQASVEQEVAAEPADTHVHLAAEPINSAQTPSQ